MSFDGRNPLLRLRNVSRVYTSGDSEVRALDCVSIDINQGEFVAIVGQSGSGKSTLVNVIGCLDKPTEGIYEVNGVDVASLDIDELARLRRDTFGFIFQRYNLLTTLSAAENVELPAIYAGRSREERTRQARALLERLGLGDRTDYRPNQLSGGQQQRVSIARALMNGPEVILADEPTGALDSHTGEEVLAELQALHAAGHTILLITHDTALAATAERVIRLKDGAVADDSGTLSRERAFKAPPAGHSHYNRWWDLAEAVRMAFRSLRGNKFRSALTLLGVVIGVGSVVTMLAVGNGSKQEVLKSIESMGSNLVLVFPGAPGTRPSGDVATLVPSDAEAIEELDNVATVSPDRRGRATLRFGSVDYQTSVSGVWPGYVQVQNRRMESGSFITEDDLRSYSAVVVLGRTVASNLFPNGENPVGKFVLVSNTPFEVIGVLDAKGANAFGSDMDDTVLMPLSTAYMRLFGQQYLNSISVKLESDARSEATSASITELLRGRHGTEDFQVRTTSSFLEATASTQNTLTILLGSVAAISLLVGGIGVMNIMLVSVTERTREIGVRMATGAPTSSIMLQFNTEALVVCGVGGLVGVALGVCTGLVLKSFGTPIAFTPWPSLVAFTSAFATGLLFGYLPARKAAYMDPVAALASE